MVSNCWCRQLHICCSTPVSTQHCGKNYTVSHSHANKMAVIPCCGQIMWHNAQSSLHTTCSIHWFHTCITVIATCLVRAKMSRYDKSPSRRPTILPRLNSLLPRHTYINFHALGGSILTEQGLIQPCCWHKRPHRWDYVNAISFKVFIVYWSIHLLGSDSFGPFFLGVALFINSSVFIYYPPSKINHVNIHLGCRHGTEAVSLPSTQRSRVRSLAVKNQYEPKIGKNLGNS